MSTSRVLVFALVAISMAAAFIPSRHAISQETNSPQPTREQHQLQVSIMRDYIQKLETMLKNHPGNDDPAVINAYIDMRKKEYEYQKEVMEIYTNAFRAQSIAAYIVLVLVVLVVVAGIAFAGFQLWKSVAIAGVQPTTELEVSASKVRVTSSVVGIIVLTISLVFLYIYTTEIFHIRVIAPQTAALKAEQK